MSALLPALLVTLILVVCAGGIWYELTQRRTRRPR